MDALRASGRVSEPVYVVPVDNADDGHHTVPIEVFASFADAQRAKEQGESSFATGLAIGLSAVAVVGLGIALCYVLFKRREPALSAPTYVPQPMPYPYPMPGFNALPAPQPAESPKQEAAKEILDYLKNRQG